MCVSLPPTPDRVRFVPEIWQPILTHNPLLRYTFYEDASVWLFLNLLKACWYKSVSRRPPPPFRWRMLEMSRMWYSDEQWVTLGGGNRTRVLYSFWHVSATVCLYFEVIPLQCSNTRTRSCVSVFAPCRNLLTQSRFAAWFWTKRITAASNIHSTGSPRRFSYPILVLRQAQVPILHLPRTPR